MSENREDIHKYSPGYRALKFYEALAFRRFYKHIQVIGTENIPFGKSYIFSPNHQNALMDALAVVNTSKTDVVFFARADIFKSKLQAKILRFLKMLPIYRIRDGASELSKNEEVFESAINVLKDHIPICIMPEGNHGDKRRLRNLVKGIFRIAFRTQEAFDKSDGVKIVPVGLDYSHYSKFFQDLLIIYGQPIEVSEYQDIYTENPPKGINALKDRLAEELKKIIIHIESDEYYDVYQSLREYYNNRMRRKTGILGRTHYDRFRADKMMIRILDENLENRPEKISELATVVRKYKDGLNNLNIRNWIFERSGFTSKKLFYKRIGLLLSFPFFLYGYLNNWIPFHLPVRKIRNIKDEQFHSSFKFVLALILFPVFYALQTIVIGFLTGPSWVAWAYLLSLPATGYFALFWSIWYKRWKAGLKYRKMKKSRDVKILSLEQDYHSMIKLMDEIVEEYLKSNK
ncbi:MAG: 1-acyl-sn-glycerol-3-phosphate acyltransferase [Bacteroidales bacterium]|nr:1-acyl-sn-glycerol-3-phosphate acyltransferase [Bacteroidales bacterium]